MCDALLDLLLTNKEELTGDVIINGSLHCRNYETIEFRILRARRKEEHSIELETRLQLVQDTGWWDLLRASFKGKWSSGKLLGLSG